ncbi:MAG: methionyl-tRNA formyltransferase [Chloracidobacterium sp.]|nr:methionyl-tRNA formyltransferase [Chloracidobacterium sp.]MCO5334357.1 methionyl-tRNA formyltransferase [Pyrinomonadaceae bacterium]
MKIVFMGTPPAAVTSLEALLASGHDICAVYTQPDRPAGRGGRLTPSAVKVYAVEHGLAIHQPEKLRAEAETERFRSVDADVAVVVAYGRILPIEYLTAFAKGAINVHFSLLPKYRGAAPVNWAIVNGDRVTGVTTMRMDTGLDTGDILMQRETDIGPEENAIELMDRLAMTGSQLLLDTLNRLDILKPTPQDNAKATIAPIMKKSDGQIDWNFSAKAIFDRIRGFQPFPGSFSMLNGRRVKLFRSEICDVGNEASPGTILAADGEDLIVKCGGNTAIRVLELQMEGRKRGGVREFINGHLIERGMRFGG